MNARSILLLTLFCFYGAVARADDAPLLPGSSLTVQDAVAKSDYVFEAKLTNAGTPNIDDSDKGRGTFYDNAQVEKPQFYKGQIHGLMPLAIQPSILKHETAPVVGQTYLFFGKQPPITGGYPVIKILAGTKDNVQATIAAVLKERAAKKLQQIQQQQGH